MKEFRKLAEEWAEKELKTVSFIEAAEDLHQFIRFGRIGYYTDKNGDRRVLSEEELSDLIFRQVTMEDALKWWNTLTYYRQDVLADKHYWSTPEKMSSESILFMYNIEFYGN